MATEDAIRDGNARQRSFGDDPATVAVRPIAFRVRQDDGERLGRRRQSRRPVTRIRKAQLFHSVRNTRLYQKFNFIHF